MAFQKSSIKLEGKVGDLTFYKRDDGHHVRQHIGHSAERIANDDSFERMRENASEFGHASNFAKKIRKILKHAFGNAYELFDDPTVANRLTRRMAFIVKADQERGRGQRRITSANLNLLTGFSMNSERALKDVFFIPLLPEFEETGARLDLHIPALNTSAVMDFPKTASLCQFHLCAMSVKDQDGEILAALASTPLLETANTIAPQSLHLNFQVDGPHALLAYFGISFYTRVAGYPVPLTKPSSNALDVIRVFNKVD